MEYTNKEPKTITIICAIVLLVVSAAVIIKGSALVFFVAAFLGAYLLTPVKSK